MYNENIIAICGRKGSGKTELASVCEELGYERISFAASLKKLVAKLIGVETVEEVDDLKNEPKYYMFGQEEFNLISEVTGIPVDSVSNELNDISLRSVRDVLQVVGTNVIRKYNENWHVNETKKLIQDGKKYVFDDVRLQNELDFIKSLNGVRIFVLRPKIDNVSNHESETTLKWQDFKDDFLICNDCDLSDLKTRFKGLVMTGMNVAHSARKCLSEAFISRYTVRSERDIEVERMDLAHALFLSKYELDYEADKFDYSVVKGLRHVNVGLIRINMNDGIKIELNPFVIEDLKLYV
jgi:hypothetical protein